MTASLHTSHEKRSQTNKLTLQLWLQIKGELYFGCVIVCFSLNLVDENRTIRTFKVKFIHIKKISSFTNHLYISISIYFLRRL